MPKEFYIMYDVDKIKDFVFDSLKPKEVKGASEMVKTLDYHSDGNMGKTMGRLKADVPDLRVIFSKGGSGLIVVEKHNKQEIETICGKLEKYYTDHTISGSLSAVFHPKSGDFRRDFAILNFKVRDRKAEKVLQNSLPVLDDSGNDRCISCMKRPPKEKNDRCDICIKKRKLGQTAVESVADISEKDLLVIYGDLNRAGELMGSLEREEQLKTFSNVLFGVLEETRQKILNTLDNNGFKYLTPVIGGDDVIIFTHPEAFGSIKDDLLSIEIKLREKLDPNIHMNFAFLVAKHNFPIFHLFNTSEELLKQTKDRFYGDEQGNQKTYHGFFWLWEGEYRPTENDVYDWEEFNTLFNMANHIHGTQSIGTSSLHTILELLKEESSPWERQMDLEYYLSRHTEFEGKEFSLKKDEADTFRLFFKDKTMALTSPVMEDIIKLRDFFGKTNKETEQ